MCRNIRTLFNFAPPATEEEIHAAALQYVRKVSGTVRPSKVNDALFQECVREIATITGRLVTGLSTQTPPRDRATEIARARVRNEKRFAKTP